MTPPLGAVTRQGVRTFADTDNPDLGAAGLGAILGDVDARLGAVPIGDVTLQASASSIGFSSVPATGRHLLALFTLRGDLAATTAAAVLRCNNDATANYHWNYVTTDGTTVSANHLSGDTGIPGGIVDAAASSAAAWGVAVVFVANYLATALRPIVVFGGSPVQGQGRWTVGGYNAAAAVSALSMVCGSGNWVAQSRATLYTLT